MFSRVPPIPSALDEIASEEREQTGTDNPDSNEMTGSSIPKKPKHIRSDLWDVRLHFICNCFIHTLEYTYYDSL